MTLDELLDAVRAVAARESGWHYLSVQAGDRLLEVVVRCQSPRPEQVTNGRSVADRVAELGRRTR